MQLSLKISCRQHLSRIQLPKSFLNRRLTGAVKRVPEWLLAVEEDRSAVYYFVWKPLDFPLVWQRGGARERRMAVSPRSRTFEQRLLP
jgi:hypothetical protein